MSDNRKSGGRSGEETSNVFSRTILEWMTSFMVLASKRALMDEDLFEIEPDFVAEHLGEHFFHKIEAAKKAWALEHPATALNANSIPEGLPPALKREILAAVFQIFKRKWIVGGLWAFAASTFSIATPMVLQQVLLRVTIGDKTTAFALCALLFLFQVSATVCINARTKYEVKLAVAMRTILYSSIYRKALLISSVSKQEFSTGKIMNMLSTDAGKIELVGTGIHSTWLIPIQIIVVSSLIIHLLGVGGIAGILTLVVISASQRYAVQAMFKYDKLATLAADARVRQITEMFAGIKIVKLFAWEDIFLSKIQQHRVSELRNLFLQISISTSFYGLSHVIPAFVCIVAFSVYSAMGNPLSATVVFPALSLIGFLKGPMIELPQKVQNLVEANVSLARFAEFLACPELEPEDADDYIERSSSNIAIKSSNASFLWDEWLEPAAPVKIGEEKFLITDEKSSSIPAARVPFLQGISFEIPKGTLCAVVGSVGAGKSSLVQALLGEMKRTEGATYINGQIAYASQQGWLQNSTLLSNILFGADMDRERYDAVITACALDKDIQNFPNGELTEVGERGVQLSGGQIARVNLARTIYSNADVLILDDPLAAVDSHVGRHIFEVAIKKLCAGKTILLVTHQLHILAQVDLILYMDGGRIAEFGAYSELMQSNKGLAILVNEYGISHSSEDEAQPSENENDSKDETLTQKQSQKHDIAPSSKESTVAPVAPKTVMMEEERLQGAVRFYHYKTYVNLCGGFGPWGLVAFTALAVNLARLFADYWLVWWSSNQFGFTNGGYIGMYVFLGLSQGLLTITLGVLAARYGIVGARRLHENAIQSISHTTMTFFDTNPLGRIVNRFSRDVAEVDRYLGADLRGIFLNLNGFLCTLGLLSYSVPSVLVVVLLVAPAYYYAQTFYRNASRELKRLENLSRSPFFSNCAESFNGLATIRAFKVSKQFVSENEKLIDAVNRPTILRYFVSIWISIRAEICLAIICLAVSTMGVGFGISPLLLGLSITYTLNLAFVANLLMNQLSSTEGRMNSVERLDHYHKNIPSEAARDLPLPRPQWPETGSISFNNAEMRYRPDLPPVLKNLTLEVKGGEKIGIVGRTGAGKSSIISALYRLVELSAGSISIDGVDLATVGLRQLRTSLSIIPQAPILFQGTIRSNVDPLNAHDDNAVWTVLEHASLKEYVSSLDEKLDSVVQENGENLSVGQRQLLCLARAMLIKPKILLIDEATASVDIKTDAAIQKALRSSFSECTILCVAHRLLTIIDYDRVLVLKDGEASEYDHPDVLLKNPESIFTDLVNETGPDMSALLKRLAGKRFGELEMEAAIEASAAIE
ncbi:P-loop containing nucleoside triphosphate hydrolase protein [Obelidium mucronatum]|nr:P-loop containing nucleoside triphosphate hydrolase protein [Obelidium mucronatum]